MADLLLSCGTGMRIFYSIMLALDGAIYWCVDVVYSVFIVICNTQLFSATTFEAFSSRIYAILGVVMLFVVAGQLLMNIADPDKAASGEASTGKLAKNIIISLVAIVLLPTVFKYLYAIQKAVVTENIIGNIIVGGYSGSTSTDFATMVENTGKDMAFTTFSAFINPVGYTGNNDKGCENSLSLTYCTIYAKINQYGTADYGKVSLLNTQQVRMEMDNGTVEYRWGLSTLAGIMITYFLLSFAIDMGVRVAKLAYYQLIAPIPIVLRIIPKKQDVFDNWVKGLTGTYLGVFIRLMVVYFCIFLINVIPAAWSNIVNSGGGSDRSIVNALVMIMLVFGVFIFMKEAPKLISSMLGVSDGDMSLGIGKKLAGAAVIGAPLAKYGKKAYGGLTGALGGGWDAMMNGEKFGVGFRAGGLGGWDKGGRQFGAQRAESYKSRTGDYKGKPGMFGGASFGTNIRGAVGEARKADIKAASEKRVARAFSKYGKDYSALESAIQAKRNSDQAKRDNYIKNAQAEWLKAHPEAGFKVPEDVNSNIMASAPGVREVTAQQLVKDLGSSDASVRRSAQDQIQAEYGIPKSSSDSLASLGQVIAKEESYKSEIEKRKAEKDMGRVIEGLMAGKEASKGSGAPAAGSTPPDGGAKK